MCGIAGILRRDGSAAAEVAIRRMTDSLSHRGPDGDGIYVSGSLALGHTRLAIIDPAGGRQPLMNEDRTVWGVVNGEVYNFAELKRELESRGHVFRTNSDSEVIIHAYEQWGPACVERLNGMYAFAVWDERRQQLFVARDRIGIKPLYYFQTSDVFAFASELPALLALDECPTEIDLGAVDLYLHLQYIPAPRTIYRGVHKLAPAHCGTVSPRRSFEAKSYWQLKFCPDSRPTEEEWTQKIDGALRSAVRSHLVADVPFGAFLSGGG